MSTSREDKLATLHPLFRAADVALRKYVAIIQRSPEASDESIEQQLIAEGCEWSMAQSTVLFVPLAFGRVIVDRMGVSAADTYICNNLSDGTTKECDLKMDITFTWAKAVVADYAGVPELKTVFSTIALRSAEVAAINNALSSGETEESVRNGKLAPSIVSMGRRPSQPWWKFWKT